MKLGDIVRHKVTARVGMVVWKKNNEQIGVNFDHFGIVVLHEKKSGKEAFDKLKALGADNQYSKDELELVNPKPLLEGEKL